MFWKRLLTSNLAGLIAEGVGVDVEDDEAADVDAVAVAAVAEGGVPVENEVVREWTLPFELAGTEPNVLIPSDLITGTAAGEDDIGAEASSMDPKVTAETGACEIGRGSA